MADDRLPRDAWGWLIPVIWILVGIALGFILGRFGRTAFTSLTFKSEFDVPQILTVVLSLAVALFVQYWLVHRGAIDSARRDYLISLGGNLRKSLSDVHSAARAGQQDGLSAAIRTSNVAFTEFEQAVKLCRIKCDLVALRKALKEHREAISLTGVRWQDMKPLERQKAETAYATALGKLSVAVLIVISTRTN